MSLPDKSSDEILQELFGLCLKTKTPVDNSTDNSTLSDDGDDKKQKYKKKKKKNKKEKKRRRDSSIESFVSGTSHKSKKQKSFKENELPNDSVLGIKIKVEKTDHIPNSETVQIKSEGTKSDNPAPNFMDVLTGRKLTIDDVFNSIGIATEGSTFIKVKKEKNTPDPIENEKFTSESAISETSIANFDGEKIDNTDVSSEKKKINEIFSDNETENAKGGPKKIKIKNLKNSSVYEATMKEIEKREKLKAERYEEGELSASSIESSDTNLKEISDKDTKLYDSSNEKSVRSSKHKKRSKSRDKSDKKRHLHKKKKHSKSSHENHRSSEKVESHRREKSSSKHHHDHHHSRHHGHDDRHCSSDNEYRDLASRRSHDSRSRKRKQSRERSRTRSRDRRKTSKHRSKSKSPEKIDKQKLLEIARKNAINLLKQGALPASVIANKDKIASIKAGGKTVDELTDFCKQLSKKEAEGHNASSSGSDIDSDEGKEKPFHHPFQIKERPSSIVMNIRNAVPLPTKTAQEKTLELSKQLSLQYPVSSGQQHRKTENEWVPVVREENTVPKTSAHTDLSVPICYPIQKPAALPIAAPTYPTVAPAPATILPPKNNIDIGSVVAQRLEAIRRLTENPQDPVGNNLIQSVDTKMQVWAESKVQPGLFTGSTGVRPLSVAELSSGCKIWPKKNQLITAKPVQSDKGEALMKKMGWQPGEGLGKYKQGPAAPFEISMKTDRKGLAEQPQAKVFSQPNTLQKAFEITQNKHPVSLLNEYCSRKKINTPQYDCEEREGASRRKLFLFSVTVQGVRYTPRMPSTNKKQSKVEAATACLQSLGLLPIMNSTVS